MKTFPNPALLAATLQALLRGCTQPTEPCMPHHPSAPDGAWPAGLTRRCGLIALGIFAIAVLSAPAAPLGSAWTYQGRLMDGNAPANGHYDFGFALFEAPEGGNPMTGIIETNGVAVSNGLFTVTLDFGANFLNGEARWLGIWVCTNGTVSSQPLAPRQPLRPSPYTLYATSAGHAGSAVVADLATAVTSGAVTSESIADGAIGPADLAVASFNGTFWKTEGNSGTAPGTHFLGTTDEQPLEFMVAGQRALRLEPNATGAPNMVGGAAVNQVQPGVAGAVIAGGGTEAYANRVRADFGTIGGGQANAIGTNSPAATVGGGRINWIGDNAHSGTIPGGELNYATNYAFAAGRRAKARHTGSFVWGDSTDADVTSGRTNQFKVRASGGMHLVAESSSLWPAALRVESTTSNGVCIYALQNSTDTTLFVENTGSGDLIRGFTQSGRVFRVLGNGDLELSGAVYANHFAGSGAGLTNLDGAHLGGGTVTAEALADGTVTAEKLDSAIGLWTRSDDNLLHLGGNVGIGTNDPQATLHVAGTVRADAFEGAMDFRPLRLEVGEDHELAGNYASIAGGLNNTNRAFLAFIGGGELNTIGSSSDSSTIGGGRDNTVDDGTWNATIGGGELNTIGRYLDSATIGGGKLNTIGQMSDSSTIGGGYDNTVDNSTWNATIGGGELNTIGYLSLSSTIGGGFSNRVSRRSPCAMIPGGYMNEATNQAFAAGTRAKAYHTGAFVWADSTDADFASTAPNQFLIRASGGVGIGIDYPETALHVAGAVRADAFEGSNGLLVINGLGNEQAYLGGDGIAEDVQLGSLDPDITQVDLWNPTRDARMDLKVQRLYVYGGANFDSTDIHLRGNSESGDVNHGLGWYGLGKPFASINVDGPVLYGWTGGVLGTTGTGQKPALSWNSSQAVEIHGNLSIPADSDLRLSGPSEGDYGLGYRGVGREFANVALDGPALWGRTGGGLCTKGGVGKVVLYWRNDGRVGIGTTNPEARLDVAGDLKADRLWVGTGNELASQFSTIAGGQSNRIEPDSPQSSIGGGAYNVIQSTAANTTISGGSDNAIGTNAVNSTIGGGWHNRIGTNSNDATVSGGQNNLVLSNAWQATIGGGGQNTVTRERATIGGGWSNQAKQYAATVSGGEANEASGWCSTVPGGRNNAASGDMSFAAGRRAKANHTGAFVWGDYTDADITSTNTNSVTLRAAGGYRLFSDSSATAGVFLANGSGTWTSMSDRHAKENFAEVNPREVLEKVAALPVTTWNYKSQDASIRHIGPMAQDFHAAFGVGENDTGITTVDADGVALAAIQGLNRKLEAQLQAKDDEIQSLRTTTQSLAQRLQRLETMVQTFTAR